MRRVNMIKTTISWENLSSRADNHIGKKDDSQFYLINFHPAGRPEAFICFVIKVSA
jgi:hypothetical protein